MTLKMSHILALAALFLSTNATPYPYPTPTQCSTSTNVCPQPLGSPTVIANVTNPHVTRDSCGSVRVGSNAFWTCRDTEQYNPSTGKGKLPVYANTCDWTTFNSAGQPNITLNGPPGAASDGNNPILQMQGCDPLQLPLLFAPQSTPLDECPPNGFCNTTPLTRWALWPNSPPMVTSSDSEGNAIAYTWIMDSNLQKNSDGNILLNPEPPCSLYKLTFDSNQDLAQPVSALVDETFWQRHQICYGTYGNIVVNGTAYLYGQTDAQRGTALAQVPASSVEDHSKYQYFVNNTWTYQMPGINDSLAIIPNAGAAGQGTFYYSEYFSSYIWLGQNQTAAGIAAHESITADVWISTAPKPEGPWIPPYKIFRGSNGNGLTHSVQAHPGLLESARQNGIYVTWTQSNDGGIYVTPLVYIQWH